MPFCWFCHEAAHLHLSLFVKTPNEENASKGQVF